MTDPTTVTLAGEDIAKRYADPHEMLRMALHGLAHQAAEKGRGLDSLKALCENSRAVGIRTCHISEGHNEAQEVSVLILFAPNKRTKG